MTFCWISTEKAEKSLASAKQAKREAFAAEIPPAVVLPPILAALACGYGWWVGSKSSESQFLESLKQSMIVQFYSNFQGE